MGTPQEMSKPCTISSYPPFAHGRSVTRTSPFPPSCRRCFFHDFLSTKVPRYENIYRQTGWMGPLPEGNLVPSRRLSAAPLLFLLLVGFALMSRYSCKGMMMVVGLDFQIVLSLEMGASPMVRTTYGIRRPWRSQPEDSKIVR